MRDMGDDVLLRYVIAQFLRGRCFGCTAVPYLSCLDVCIALMENNNKKEQMFLIGSVNCDIVYVEQMFV